MPTYCLHYFTLMTVLLLSYGGKAISQTHFVIVDKETLLPVYNAGIITNDGHSAHSTKTGEVTINQSFKSITINHVSYLQRKMSKEELQDTIWLLPNAIHLREVLVLGEDRPLIKSLVKSATKDTPLYGQNDGISFDFFKMFEKKPLSRKARRKNKEILENWDKEYNKEEDPPALPKH